MRFQLLDRIETCEPGKALRGVKRLTLAEEYLHDHFPGFPIMPGVLQLQTLVEAASWLLRITDDFRDSVVVLREVKSVKYGSMMQPGKTLSATVELTSRDGSLSDANTDRYWSSHHETSSDVKPQSSTRLGTIVKFFFSSSLLSDTLSSSSGGRLFRRVYSSTSRPCE